VCKFFGTEADSLGGVFAFNLLGLDQRQHAPVRPYRQPSTLRSQVFVSGAILGLVGKQTALRLSPAWGGVAKHEPLENMVLPVVPAGFAEGGLRPRTLGPRRSRSLTFLSPATAHFFRSTSAFGLDVKFAVGVNAS